MRNIVLNIPHASINGLFDPEIGGWTPNPHFMNDCVRKKTDWYTDLLFPSDGDSVKAVVFPYSRFVCDVGRMADDSLEKEGEGIIYTQFGGYTRKELNAIQREKIKGLWNKHQRQLKDSLTEGGVLLDCHSFSGTHDDKDICIGFNDDEHYDKRLVATIIDTFHKGGYSVSVNTPYSGTTTLDINTRYASVLIAVNKRVYLNETLLTLERSQYKWTQWFGCIKKVFEAIHKAD